MDQRTEVQGRVILSLAVVVSLAIGLAGYACARGGRSSSLSSPFGSEDLQAVELAVRGFWEVAAEGDSTRVAEIATVGAVGDWRRFGPTFFQRTLSGLRVSQANYFATSRDSAVAQVGLAVPSPCRGNRGGDYLVVTLVRRGRDWHVADVGAEPC